MSKSPPIDHRSVVRMEVNEQQLGQIQINGIYYDVKVIGAASLSTEASPFKQTMSKICAIAQTVLKDQQDIIRVDINASNATLYNEKGVVSPEFSMSHPINLAKLGNSTFRASTEQFTQAKNWSQTTETCSAVFQSIFASGAVAAGSSSSSSSSSGSSGAGAPQAVAASSSSSAVPPQPVSVSSRLSGTALKTAFLNLIEEYRKENDALPITAITTEGQANQRIAKLEELKRAAKELKKFHQDVHWKNESTQKAFLKKMDERIKQYDQFITIIKNKKKNIKRQTNQRATPSSATAALSSKREISAIPRLSNPTAASDAGAVTEATEVVLEPVPNLLARTWKSFKSIFSSGQTASLPPTSQQAQSLKGKTLSPSPAVELRPLSTSKSGEDSD